MVFSSFLVVGIMARSKSPKPNETQKAVRGWIKGLINIANGIVLEEPITPEPEGSEAWYRDKLANELKGKVEVQTPVGRIDILTSREVIEVKNVKRWLHAKGQVKGYGHYYPEHKLRIHLFGAMTESKLKTIKQHCEAEGIALSWE